MKTSGLFVRAAIVTGLLAAVTVPAANALTDNTPNYGQSGKTLADPSPAAAGAQGNGNGVGRPDYWGGCRGIHGVENPGQGLGNGLNGGSGVGSGNGNAYGLDKEWKQCPAGDEDVVEGTSYSMPETR